MEGLNVKHIPMRTCIACREKLPKRDMVRIVRDVDGCVFVDSKGKVRGRGANLCPKVECLQKACKKNLIRRALELDSAIDEKKCAELMTQFESVLHNREFRQGNKKVVLRIDKENLV